MAVSDVTFDVLVASGTPLPPSGQGGGERWRIAFPRSAEVADKNDGGQAVVMTRYRSAVMTLTALQDDAAHTVMRALHTRQAAGERLAGGQASLVLSGETVRWGAYTITQPADIVSASSVQTVTWEIALQDATITPGA